MEKITKLRKLFQEFNLDGYIIPKNNNFFGEYVPDSEDNLKYISNFTGSAGFAVILKNKNYIFVDGRYTIQAGIQCGKEFQVCNIPKEYPFNIFKKKNLNLGFDPKLHTESSLNRLFSSSFIRLKPINENLIDRLWKRKKNLKIKSFYLIKDQDAGLKVQKKLDKLLKIINFNKVDYLLTTASENVAWLLNIRGQDTSYSPLPNSHALIDKSGKVLLFCNSKKINKSLKTKINRNVKIYDFNLLPTFFLNLFHKKVLIDSSSCSFFYKSIIEKNNFILEKQDQFTI